MARITVEDCLQHVTNRFELVLMASKRARQLANGVDPLIPREKDKPTVLALREIAAGLIKPALLEEIERQHNAQRAREEAQAEELAAREDLPHV